MSKNLESPYTLSEIRKNNEGTGYNFELKQLEISNSKDLRIVFDLVNSGSGSLFIYEVYLERQKIGSAWSKSYPLKKIGPYGNFVYAKEQSPAFFYSTEKVFKTPEEALQLSKTHDNNPYCFDEYFWDEDDCDYAWFPTFDTLQQLIDFHNFITEG